MLLNFLNLHQSDFGFELIIIISMIQFRKLIARSVYCFSVEGESESVERKQSTLLTEAEKTFSNIPIHMKPYNAAKYEIPSSKIRKNSGNSSFRHRLFNNRDIAFPTCKNHEDWIPHSGAGSTGNPRRLHIPNLHIGKDQIHNELD